LRTVFGRPTLLSIRTCSASVRSRERAGYRSVFGGLFGALFAVDGVVGSDDLGLVALKIGFARRRPAADTRRLASIFAPAHSPIRRRRGLRRGDDFISLFGQVWWSVVPGLEPSFLAATFGMLPIGLGVD